MNKIVLIAFICLFSFSLNAKQQIIKCNFIPVAWGDFKSKLLGDFLIPIEFKTLSKTNWKMNKINLPDRFREKLIDAFNKETEMLEQILFTKKFNNEDKEYIEMLIQSGGLDYTVDEFIREIKKLNNNQKKEFIRIYKEDTKEEYYPMISEAEKLDLNEVKKTFNSRLNIYLDNQFVILESFLDNGTLIKNKIKYPDILNGTTKNMMQGELMDYNGFTTYFDSECKTDSKLIKISDDTNSNNNTIELKLKKLKSLFEQELITQDEYDVKRKEILDEM